MTRKNIFFNVFNSIVEGRQQRIRAEIAQYRKTMGISQKDVL